MSDDPVPTTPGVELRLYPTFGEVRLLVTSAEDTLKVTFPTEAWQQVVPHSPALLDLPFASMALTRHETWLSGLEGQRLWLQTPAGRQDVTLVRADDLLVQDQTGAYFRAEERQLLFPDLPPVYGRSEVYHLNFLLRAPGQGVMSYLTWGLIWKARYTLEIAADDAVTLTAHAELHNRTDQPVVPETLTLLAGEVPLSARSQRVEDYAVPLYAKAESPMGRPEMEEAKELAGLYRFDLKQPPALPAHSTVTVPFQPLTVTALQRLARLSEHFTDQVKRQGVLKRHYRFSAAQPLLAATVTIREQSYIVGQSVLRETAAGEVVSLTLGRDPDVTYRRSLEVLDIDRRVESPDDEPDEQVEVTRTTYRITYSVRNAKRRTVEIEIEERLDADEVHSVEGDGVLRDGTLHFEQSLGPGEVKTLTTRLVREVKTDVEQTTKSWHGNW